MEEPVHPSLSIEAAFAYLTSRKVRSFYALVINSLERIPAPGCKTMAVAPHRGRYVMFYDPAFVARVSVDELTATLEHEVLHIILHHIPRYLRLSQVYEDNADDKALFEMSSNTAMDLADNCLLAKNWPRIKDKDKPLGYWILPTEFEGDFPWDLDYENYHKLVTAILKQRLKTPPSKLYEMAKKAMQQQQQATQQALSQASGAQPPPKEGDGDKGQEQDQGQSQGQGQGQGQDPDEDLDPVDQLALQMLMEGLKKHGAWKQGSEKGDADSHKLEDHGREIIKSAVEQQEKTRGTVPGHAMELIKKMLQPPTVPWTQFLHDVVQRTRQTKKVRGMSRPSKTLSAFRVMGRKAQKEMDEAFEKGTDVIGLQRIQQLRSLARMSRVPPFPGVKHSNKFTILYAVDTSGSMSTKDLQQALSELQHIQKSDSDVSITVIYADTGVCKEYEISSTSEIDPKLVGRGGTSFEPVFLRAVELSKSQDKAPDILVYATDGWAPPPVTKLGIPVVWIITPGGQVPCKDAGHIAIEMKNYQLGEGY